MLPSDMYFWARAQSYATMEVEIMPNEILDRLRKEAGIVEEDEAVEEKPAEGSEEQPEGVEEKAEETEEKAASEEKTAEEKLASFRERVNEIAQELDIDDPAVVEKYANDAIGGRIAARTMVEEIEKVALGGMPGMLGRAGGMFGRGGAKAGIRAGRAIEGAGSALAGGARKVQGAVQNPRATAAAAGGAIAGGARRAGGAAGAAVAGGARRVDEGVQGFGGGIRRRLGIGAAPSNNLERRGIPGVGNTSRMDRQFGYGAIGAGAGVAGGGAYLGIDAVRNRNRG